MKNIAQAAIAVATAAIIAGCSSTPGELQPVASVEPFRPCYFPGSDEDAPRWVCTGHVDGMVTGIGQFPPSRASYNLRFQTAEQR